ncbi:MAG: PEP-CTERM sorting domain-containing protein [Armatimonadota bacterium]|nr:PEP-CTERM sorting domain-containing protein [bacterium]
MYTRTVLFVCLMIFSLSVVSMASLPTCNVVYNGNTTIYRYTYTNTDESSDFVTGLHIYAPVEQSAVTEYDPMAGWMFSLQQDTSGATDIAWCTDGEGLASGASLVFSISVPSSLARDDNYVLEDFPVGNWGYDVQSVPGVTWTMFGSVPVPVGSIPAAVPEPGSLLALLGGCATFAVRIIKTRRR